MTLSFAPIFANGMVLQRDLTVCVWGTTLPSTRVDVQVQGQSASTRADDFGQWRCTLAPLHASDNETLEVAAGDERITLTDVAVGEVFIADWRDAWQRPDLPFLVVQIPGFGDWMGLGPNDYMTIRACQQKVADEDEHVWLCSASDMGDKHDIHPKEKKPIGERLALLAMRHLLGMPVPADAPRCVDAERKGSFVILRFEDAAGGMLLEGAEVNALEVLCEGEALPFRAAARGDELIVMLDGSPEGPIEVRFAWSNWFRTNLYNGAEIPALPFAVSC
jgi:hypothetical protein